MRATSKPSNPSPIQFIKVAILVVCAAVFYTGVATGGFYRKSHERNYYDMLAEGFLAGQTSLLVEPPPGLVSAFERRDYEKMGNEGTLLDAALYKGRYYLYFGPTPAVLCAAWKATTRGSACDGVSFVVLFAVVALLGIYFALHGLERLMAASWPLGRRLVLGCFAAAAIQLYLIGFPKIYHLSIGAGTSFVLVSLAVFLWYLGGSRRPLFSLFFVGALLGLAVSSRITMVFYASAVAAALTWVEWKRPAASPNQIVSRLVAFAAPLAATGCALLAYNWVRFGSPLEFGVTYTLTTTASRAVIDEGRLFSLGNVPQNLYWYFFYIPPVSSAFPYFALKEVEAYRFHSSSAFLTGPITLLAFVPVLALISGRLGGVLASGVLALAVGTAATTACMLTFFGSTKRYEYDFLPVWYLLAYLGLRQTWSWWPQARAWRVLSSVTAATLVIWSLGMGALLGVTSYSQEFPPYLLVGHWTRRAEAVVRPGAQIQVDLGRTSGYPPELQRLAIDAYKNDRQFVMAWQGTIVTDPVQLKPGVYDLELEHFSYVSTADHVYAQFEVSVETEKGALIPLADSQRWESSPNGRIDRVSSFYLPAEAGVRVRIAYLNDATGSLADRNLYLTALWFRKSKRDQRSLFVQPKLAELSGYPAEWNALAVSEVARTGEFTMAWQGTVHTPVIDLAAGDYELVVEHRGTPLAGQYPIANVQVVGGPDGALKMLDERFTSEGTARVYRSRPFHVQDKTAARISIAFLNDLGNGIEDRNLFLRGVYVLRGGSR